jgi:hypothetical protein
MPAINAYGEDGNKNSHVRLNICLLVAVPLPYTTL